MFGWDRFVTSMKAAASAGGEAVVTKGRMKASIRLAGEIWKRLSRLPATGLEYTKLHKG